jgi:hypothetical protein
MVCTPEHRVSFLKTVHADFDYVVLDNSPIMAAADTTSLAPMAYYASAKSDQAIV